jgi:catechol 2,3-dioxygenase-like lactoylglutathione lyase family enzyme
VIKTHHVAITVSDLGRSLKFYGSALGLTYYETTVVNENLVYRLFGLVGVKVLCAKLGAGRAGNLELFHFDPGKEAADKYDFERVGYQHVAFEVRDIEEIGRRLQLSGVEVLCAPVTVNGGAKTAFIRDPDGNIVELIEIPFGTTPIGRAIAVVNKIFGKRARAGRALVGTTISRQAEK